MMHPLDIAIVVLIFAALAVLAYRTQRYTQGVADFLAANRCAGRYLLTMADGMAGVGAITFIGSFQQYYDSGFPSGWWGAMLAPIGLFVTLSGFVAYRFRETRVMTIAQFYEMRYSRNFRIFAGMTAWFSGIINYGIFPAVTARFFIYFCDIPVRIWNVGGFEINLTLGAVMAVLLTVAATIALRGGQIAIMVTDFLQAQFVNIVFLIVLAVLVLHFGWGDIVAALKEAPEGKSMLNPFEQKGSDFSIIYFAILIFHNIYSTMAWQGNQGYYCSAKTPHDAKMARVLGAWRFGVTWTVILLIPICAYAFLNGAQYITTAQPARDAITALGDPSLQRELTVPLAVKALLPVGVFGLFVAAMLAAAVSTDDTYLHSWGSIFIQDVVMPLRKKPLTPTQHLSWIRRSIVGVAVFAWVFGMLFPLNEFIFMYWAITGAIYVAGAGSVIIGGFYWKRATTAGAWAAMCTGCTLAILGWLGNNVLWPKYMPAMKQAWPASPWIQNLENEAPLNGMHLLFIGSILSVVAYVLVSLLTKPKPDFNMDKMLHRGAYAVEGEHAIVEKKRHRLLALLGVDREYSRFDTFLAVFLFSWTIFWFLVFLAGTAWGLLGKTTEDGWALYWLISTLFNIVIGVITIIWFLWKGFADMFQLFRDLNAKQRDTADDGAVHPH